MTTCISFCSGYFSSFGILTFLAFIIFIDLFLYFVSIKLMSITLDVVADSIVLCSCFIVTEPEC